MKRTGNGKWQYSPKDLIAWLEGDFAAWCERESAELRTVGGGGGEGKPSLRDKPPETAARYGNLHEKAHLERLRQEAPDLVEVDSFARDAERRTMEALGVGSSIVYQGVLASEGWRGIADFLFRIDSPSTLGEWSYEPRDTKLARSAKPYFLLQLCTYAFLLERLQGRRPERLSFILGDDSEESFRTEDFWHYFQHLKRSFERFQTDWQADAQPDPGADRSHGEWSERAAQLLADRDDLSLVANISRSHVLRLREAGIPTLTALGSYAGARPPAGITLASFATLRTQAAMQLKSRERGEIAWELRPVSADLPARGLELLPPPSPLDVFYDIEGFPYATNGLEYLQGATTVTDEGSLAFQAWWAHDEIEEKKSFEEFVDWVWDRWQQDPKMHIYHYAAYERSALSRLSTRYATREAEIDALLRADVLVDLYTVVRQGLVIGTKSYSLKDVELLYLPAREGQVVSAGASVEEYQRWLDSGEPKECEKSPILTAIREYNQEDCESTARLRDWLLERQREAELSYRSGAKNGASESDVASVATRTPTEREVLAATLLERATQREGEERRVTELLAWLLEFHRRDDKPKWWRYFERRNMEERELYDDPDCLARVVRTDRAPWPDRQSLVYEFTFDAEQESRLHEGSAVYLIGGEESTATIDSYDADRGLLTIKRSAARTMPTWCHLIPNEVVNPRPIPDAVETYVREWANGATTRCAIDDLLYRRPPRLRGRNGGPVVRQGVDLLDETIAVVRAMDATTLAIQGPPGTGKTTTAAHVIRALLDDGQRIGIVANSHAVVNHLLAKVGTIAPDHIAHLFKVGGPEAPQGITHVTDSAKGAARVSSKPIVLGGTAWFFSRDDMQGTLDYLFVDEAGQVSLANVVGSGSSARNIILIGDQMQLAQPIQGAHPGESGMSSLEYLLQEHQTIPEELGILLNKSYRMHPEICRFISESYYEGRVSAVEGTRDNRIDWDGPATGVHYIGVIHEGRTHASEEEVEAVRALVDRLVGQSVTIGSITRELALDDILIVAPFNAQVRALKAAITGAQIGTVDKFQGREAPVVIVSMSASTLDDAPRGASFLLDPHRLNVAVSRAQALALVVGSTRLSDVRVRSVQEMQLVNGWCRIESMV